jgi:predicted hydrocarbon binding protein
MLSVFLSKLLTSRQANFTEEGIQIFDLPFNMQPVESLVDLQKMIEDKLKKKSAELLIEFGRHISGSMITHFKTRFGLRGNYLRQVWLDMYSLSGFGKLDILRFDDKSAFFQTENSAIAKTYVEKYGQRKEPVCQIICGMLEVYFKEVTGKKAKCVETGCIATGKKYCTFEIH